ncbi:16277_t:CDS:2 [Acaulospora colombiana]|uniref:16277_t:CDS:1 n=1 Tax=Acaulospora colombiana TaxID=27376 RepID=A0ACA9KDP4_9GLOM|nr:16277_t:CDS:2 [Acaulospora colombiana]
MRLSNQSIRKKGGDAGKASPSSSYKHMKHINEKHPAHENMDRGACEDRLNFTTYNQQLIHKEIMGSNEIKFEYPKHDSEYTFSTSSTFVNEDNESGEPLKSFEKRLLRKIDVRLMPITILTFFVACLDRSNIGNARLGGLEKDLGLSSGQYQIALAVFFIGEVVMKIPSNMVLHKFAPSKWIPFIMIVWSAVTCCMAVIQDYKDLIVTRVLLGITEAGLAPGIIYLLSMWYSPKELATRFAVYYSGGVSAGAFGFLTDKERVYLMTQLGDDSMTTKQPVSTKEFTKNGIVLAFKDWKIYHTMLIKTICGITINSITLFLPTLLYSMGFDILKSQLLTVPPYLVAMCFSLLVALHSDKVGERPAHVIGPALLAILGFVLMSASLNRGVSYFATFLCSSGVWTMSPIMLTWVADIFPFPHEKRLIAQAMVLTLSNISGIISSNLYPSRDAPSYRKNNPFHLFNIIIAHLSYH